MELNKHPLTAIVVLLASAASATAATSIADGSWTDSGTWDGGAPPDQSLNGGNGDAVFINSDIVVPSGVDFVNTTTIDINGDPVDGNLWMFFNGASALGSSLTIQNGARVGSRFWTQIAGTTTDSSSVTVQSGGEYITAGINNGSSHFTIDVEAGGVLTFDASIHPNFTDIPNAGFYRGNVNAGPGASNTFNIEGRLDVVDIDNSNVGDGTNTYTLINGGVINEVPTPGQAIGINSPGSALPDGSISYAAIAVSGSGRVTNAFGGGGITHVPAGLTIDIADQSVFDTDAIGDDWTAWVIGNGGDPTTQAGPRTASIGGGEADTFTGTGTIQFDFYGFNVNDQGTPDPSDDTLDGVFTDQLNNGPGDAAESTFSGTFELGYVGPALTDDDLAVINGSTPAILLINGATNGTFFDNLAGLSIPDQVWSDGTRQYDVSFSDAFFFDLPEPFPPGTPDTRLLFTTLESITARAGLVGDYNGDGTVDAADYVVWRKTNINGAQGYVDWRANFGQSLGGSAGASAVPEPSSLLLLLAATLAMFHAARPARA